MRIRFVVAALAGALVACGPGGGGATWHSDVQPILEARCQSCHRTGGAAPFALATPEDAQTYGPAMVAAVHAGRMPPWRAAKSDVSYLRDPSLTDDEKAALAQWVDRGMPLGDASAKKREVKPLTGGLDRTDLVLSMPEVYTPTGTPDDYRCFPVTWPKNEPMAVTGFDARPGSTKMAHHIALYLIPPEAAALVQGWDRDEAGPGYECFGGPFGRHPQEFAVQLVTAWIPGSQGVALPRGMGIEVPPGALLVLQMHYNTQQGIEPDKTELAFKLEKSAPRRAAYQPFLKIDWVAGAMNIPPGESAVLHQHVADPRPFFKLLGSPLNLDNGFNLEAVMFHMHRLGTVGELYVEKANGTRNKVLSIPAWDFHWQIEYFFDQPVRFEPGDTLRLRCTFDNSEAKKKPGQTMLKEVNWGENSDEEMCVANILSTEP